MISMVVTLTVPRFRFNLSLGDYLAYLTWSVFILLYTYELMASFTIPKQKGGSKINKERRFNIIRCP